MDALQMLLLLLQLAATHYQVELCLQVLSCKK